MRASCGFSRRLKQLPFAKALGMEVFKSRKSTRLLNASLKNCVKRQDIAARGLSSPAEAPSSQICEESEPLAIPEDISGAAVGLDGYRLPLLKPFAA